MSGRIAFAFPGQGSQRAGMFADPRVAPERTQAQAVTGRDLATADADDPVVTQLSLLAFEVAAARLVREAGIAPDVVAGHSVGAFAAAVEAGVFTFADALAIVHRRAELMAERSGRTEGLAAIVGLDLASVDALVARAGGPGAALFRANVNAPRNVVVAGDRVALAALVEDALRHGAARARLLDVPVASHSPLLAAVAASLRTAFEAVPFRRPRLPVALGSDGRIVRDPERIREDLFDGVARPVRWDLVSVALREFGVTTIVETGPGTVLSDLARGAEPCTPAFTFDGGIENLLAATRLV